MFGRTFSGIWIVNVLPDRLPHTGVDPLAYLDRRVVLNTCNRTVRKWHRSLLKPAWGPGSIICLGIDSRHARAIGVDDLLGL
jgi:hypothetical protein